MDASDAAAHPCRAAPTEHQVSVSSYYYFPVTICYFPVTRKVIFLILSCYYQSVSITIHKSITFLFLSVSIHYYPFTSHYYPVTIFLLSITIHHCPIAKTPGETGSRPGGNPGANLKPISLRCYHFEVAFVWELTKETIHLPLGCLQVGDTAVPRLPPRNTRYPLLLLLYSRYRS